MEESPFKGSNLETTINNTKNADHLYNLTDSAFKKQPKSKFWKEAFELISKKHKKNESSRNHIKNSS
ncbi:hypothetical protein SAMN04488130_109105 [Flavobacterium urumqiense]|uniref:Uncharacterized protein n=1 Tax=Flavobacterium urumqiense TaxID=935224 RepID=A0A1H5Z5V6_9FLAO|nr:hypothetical protein SAMN04488130_109105 [Flavobacterium urumqiense]